MTPSMEKMKIAGNLAARTLDHLSNFISPGVTTDFLDQKAYDFIIENNAISACYQYTSNGTMPPYPKHTCISVNHVVCHGVPGDKVLRDGDSLNIDVTVIVDGHHGDTSRMFFVGKPSVKHKRLSDVTYELMMRSIELLKPGTTIANLGRLGDQISKKYNLKVLDQFCGHGIGTVFHQAPSVINFIDERLPDWNHAFKEGDFITIEPILTTGKGKVKMMPDRWTIVTCDREPAAQWEHTIAITSDGFEIMTL